MLFEVAKLTYRYDSLAALDNLSLAFPEGSRVALVGANGSGKSTLLRLLDGLYFPQSGAVRFRGEELTEERFADDRFAFRFRRQVGLVFQNPDVQLFNPTVFDEVAFAPLQLRWPKSEVRQRVAEILERLRLSHLKDRVPHSLSGGEKKRVALASVLPAKPIPTPTFTPARSDAWWGGPPHQRPEAVGRVGNPMPLSFPPVPPSELAWPVVLRGNAKTARSLGCGSAALWGENGTA
ncbi:MAG: ABC transporter ATP-binding protein [Bryobacteraceae bacterium]